MVFSEVEEESRAEVDEDRRTIDYIQPSQGRVQLLPKIQPLEGRMPRAQEDADERSATIPFSF